MSDTAGLILLAGRIVFSFFFVMAGYRHIVGGAQMTEYARGVGFPVPALAPWPSGIVLVAGGVSIAGGIWPDIGTLLLIAFLVPAAVWFHPFWKTPDDQTQAANIEGSRTQTHPTVFMSAVPLAAFTWFAAGGGVAVRRPSRRPRPGAICNHCLRHRRARRCCRNARARTYPGAEPAQRAVMVVA